MAQKYSITPRELSKVWRLLLNTGETDPDKLFSPQRINKAVDDLVGLGEIPKEAAQDAKAAAAYGGELATGRTIGTEFTADVPEQINERYFDGSSRELKQERTKQRFDEPTRRRLKPVEDIEAGMLDLIRKSFSTSHGRRFYRQVRNEYLKSIGKPPITLKAIRNELRTQKARETASQIPSAARKAAFRTAKGEERKLGSTSPSRTTGEHRRNLGKLTSAELPSGLEFSPDQEAEISLRRLQRLRFPKVSTPVEGANAESQKDDPESERIADARASKLRAREVRIRAREVRMLQRILKSNQNPVTGERLTKSERNKILKLLQEPSGSSGSIAKTIDVAGKKVASAAGGLSRSLRRALRLGSMDAIREGAGRPLGQESSIRKSMLRGLAKMLYKASPGTKGEVEKISRRKKAMEILREKMRGAKPKKGDAPTKGFESPDKDVIVGSSAKPLPRGASDAEIREWKKRGIASLGKARLSPRILNEPAALPRARGGRVTPGYRPGSGPGQGNPQQAELAPVNPEQEISRILDDRAALELMRRNAVDPPTPAPRRDRGGAHSLRLVSPPGERDIDPERLAELIRRAEASARSGKTKKLVKSSDPSIGGISRLRALVQKARNAGRWKKK